MAPRTATRTAAPPPMATDELPDRTRWALDAYAALLLDRRLAQQTLLNLNEHIVEAEASVKTAAAADGVTVARLAKARLAMAEATGLDVAGASAAAGPARRSGAKRATRAPTARRRART